MTETSENIKRCAICGKRLPKGRRLYCSDECAREGSKAMDRARGGAKAHPEPYHWITCPDCGRDVYVHIKSKRCPDCQRIADNRHNQEHRQRAKAGHSRKLGSTDLCERCGKPYVVNAGKQRYCRACASIASAETDRAASREWNREHYSTPEAREERNARRRAAKPYNKTCVVCGKAFTSNDIRTMCCSDECKKTRLRAYYRDYDAARKETKLKAERERAKRINSDPEKREERNRKAREAYARRKAAKEERHD